MTVERSCEVFMVSLLIIRNFEGGNYIKVSNKIIIYFFSIAIIAALSCESFLKYDKTHKGIWLIPTVLFAVAFFAIAIDLFKWWAKVYRG